MRRAWRWGPRQQAVVDRAGIILDRLAQDASPAVVRQAWADGGVLAVDLPVDHGGGGGGLGEAMALAELLGLRASRGVSAAVLEACPLRLLGVMERGRVLRQQLLGGAAPVALLDVSAANVRLERRPGQPDRLVGDVPPLLIPAGARHWLVVFEARPDWLGLALLSSTHAALRVDGVEGVPLALASGVLDVAVEEEALALDASLEVSRALAAEELLKAARTVAESAAVTWPLGPIPSLLPARDRLLVARTSLHVAAERLLDGGALTLLGEDSRFGAASAALEARAVARQALQDAAWVHNAALEARGDNHPSSTVQVPALLDVADSVPHDVVKGVWFRLGDGRQGALFANRTRPPPARQDSRTPLPVEVAPDTERKSGLPARSTTSRAPTFQAQWGPLPFVSEDARRVQVDARMAALELLDPHHAALDRDGVFPPGALEAATARGLCQPGSVPALIALAEELGRVHPAWASTLLSNATLSLALGHAPALQALLDGVVAGQTPTAVVWSSNLAPAVKGWSATADGVGRQDAALLLVVGPVHSVLVQPSTGGVTLEAKATTRTVVPGVLRVVLEQASPLQVLEGEPAAALVDAFRLGEAARLCGITTHVLEVWRASLNGRPDATRVMQAERLGQCWAWLAQVRAAVWVATTAGATPQDRDAAWRAAKSLASQVLERAITGAGVDALRPGARLGEHVQTVRLLRLDLAARGAVFAVIAPSGHPA
jgi:hypothetical protein